MTTTTLEAIRDALVPVIEALSPSAMANVRFRRGPRRRPFRDWAEGNATSACLRRFALERIGEIGDSEVLDPSAREVRERVRLSISYPVSDAIYGANDLDDMEDIVRNDARQVRDAITLGFTIGNWPAGQNNAGVIINPPERGAWVWFQDLEIDFHYYEVQA